MITGLSIVDKLKGQKDVNGTVKVCIYACEESSRFGVACIGSKYLKGELDQEGFKTIVDQKAKKNEETVTLSDQIKRYIEEIRNAIPDIELVDKIYEERDNVTSLETHIEQYDELDKLKKQNKGQKTLGIVTSIGSAVRVRYTVKSKGNVDKEIRALSRIARWVERHGLRNELLNEGRASQVEANSAGIEMEDLFQGKKVIQYTLKGETGHTGSTPMGKRKSIVNAMAHLDRAIGVINRKPSKEVRSVTHISTETLNHNSSFNQIPAEGTGYLIVEGDLDKEGIVGLLKERTGRFTKKDNVEVVFRALSKKEIHQLSDARETYGMIDFRLQGDNTAEKTIKKFTKFATSTARKYHVAIHWDIVSKGNPAKTSSTHNTVIRRECAQRGINYADMLSYPGQDSGYVPVKDEDRVMLFIPSTGGSHNPEEATTREDIETGIEISGSLVEKLMKTKYRDTIKTASADAAAPVLPSDKDTNENKDTAPVYHADGR